MCGHVIRGPWYLMWQVESWKWIWQQPSAQILGSWPIHGKEKRDPQGYEQACKSHLETDYSSGGFLWYKKETLAHDEKRDFGEWTQKDAQNKKKTVAFWKIKCIIPHVLPTKNITRSHFSSTILLLFSQPLFFSSTSVFYAPTKSSGWRPKSKRDPSVFDKKPLLPHK